MQAWRFERLSFDPFPLLQDGFVSPEVDVRRCDVVQALVVALMVVVIDEGFDLGFEITGQEVVFQQDAVLQGLMPTLDLAWGLRVIRCATRMLHALVLEPFSQFARDVAGPVVTEQTWFVDYVNLIATGCFQSQIQRVRHVLGSHVRTEFP